MIGINPLTMAVIPYAPGYLIDKQGTVYDRNLGHEVKPISEQSIRLDDHVWKIDRLLAASYYGKLDLPIGPMPDRSAEYLRSTRLRIRRIMYIVSDYMLSEDETLLYINGDEYHQIPGFDQQWYIHKNSGAVFDRLNRRYREWSYEYGIPGFRYDGVRCLIKDILYRTFIGEIPAGLTVYYTDGQTWHNSADNIELRGRYDRPISSYKQMKVGDVASDQTRDQVYRAFLDNMPIREVVQLFDFKFESDESYDIMMKIRELMRTSKAYADLRSKYGPLPETGHIEESKAETTNKAVPANEHQGSRTVIW